MTCPRAGGVHLSFLARAGALPEDCRYWAFINYSHADAKDAALLAILAPGNHTVQVSSTAGIGLIEIYEVP